MNPNLPPNALPVAVRMFLPRGGPDLGVDSAAIRTFTLALRAEPRLLPLRPRVGGLLAEVWLGDLEVGAALARSSAAALEVGA